MLGFEDAESALTAYQANYELGWQGAGSIHPMRMPQCKDWLKGDATKPVSGVASIGPVKDGTVIHSGTNTVEEGDSIATALVEKEPASELKPEGEPHIVESRAKPKRLQERDAAIAAKQDEGRLGEKV